MNSLNTQITNDLKSHLAYYLESNLPKDFYEVFSYAILPAGKLFRSNLVWKCFCDLSDIDINNINTADYPNVQKLSSAVEFHHVYTLLHDDLPCMDDDDYRRGKLSTHKKYNEWIALLAGDGLLNLSYETLASIEHPNTVQIIREFSKLCGPQGLILGQYMDLKQDNEVFNFQNILTIHQLKTANLFTCCLLGGTLLSPKAGSFTHTARNIGKSTGIIFQLIDDLTELCEKEVSQHEKAINPWIHDFHHASTTLLTLIKELNIETQATPNIKRMIEEYMIKIKNRLESNIKTIEIHLSESLGPIISNL